MPKKSSVKVPMPEKSTLRGSSSKEGKVLKCIRCGREFGGQKGNFSVMQSPLYAANDHCSPICKHCFMQLYNQYTEQLGDNKEALYRMCMKFDIYWNETIYEMLGTAKANTSLIMAYITKANQMSFRGKTFDDTIIEERENLRHNMVISELRKQSEEEDAEPLIIPQETIDYWGSGLMPEMYVELEKRKSYWQQSGNVDFGKLDIGAEVLLKQICMLEVTINKDVAAGRSADKSINTLNTLLGSANMKPIQRDKDATSSLITEKPLGVVWKMIEETEPIVEKQEEFKDVDGIIRYVTIWFFGHMCKMLHIKNKYSRLYEEEMRRLQVERPEYEGEDEEEIFEDIFERAEREEAEREAELRKLNDAEEADKYAKLIEADNAKLEE